jgi:hypothetical protein
MKTRMPQFGAANVAGLPALFAEVDAPLRDEREPEFTAEAVEAGKLLAGTKGLGCIQCHDFAGHPSIGIPAVDLAKVHERIYPGWFRELLMDPVALKMNTRMPEFWVAGRSPVKDVLGGDPARQVEALWSYLSLGSSMPLPEGLVPLPGEYEVEVYDEPVCVGVFMEGVSPRTICVGLPERVHYAFDVENSRLALAWRGRFLDARGTWHARAGQLEKPAGEDVFGFPSGPALARLATPDAPWPTDEASHYRVLGRRIFLDGRPRFRYEFRGSALEEELRPVLRPYGAALLRVLSGEPFPSDAGIHLRVATGESIERTGASEWLVRDGERMIGIRGVHDAAFVVVASGRSELRLPFCGDTATSTMTAMPVGSDGKRKPCTVTALHEIEYAW